MSEHVLIDVTSRGNAPYRIEGTIEQHAGKHLVLGTAQEIAIESEIRTQARDLLFLGCVLRCEPSPGEQRFAVHVNLKRTLLVI